MENLRERVVRVLLEFEAMTEVAKEGSSVSSGDYTEYANKALAAVLGLPVDTPAADLDLTNLVMRIKLGIRWFPRTILDVERRAGKTTAILELIHEQHEGKAVYVAHNQRMAESGRYYYAQKYSATPDRIERPVFISGFDVDRKLRGYEYDTWPIYVDEWWLFDEREQREVMDTLRVVGRVGTSMVVR